MKTNKKLKTSFVSLLTLISSAFSVVACGSKNKPNPGDQNYQDFVSSIKKIDLNENNFIDKTILKDRIERLPYFSDLSFSIDNNFSENKIKLYGMSSGGKEDVNSTNLTDLKEDKINIDKSSKEVNIELNNKIFPLKNILFASNFNLKITKDNNSMFFNDVTAFFELDADFNISNNSYDLNLEDTSNFDSEPINKPDVDKMLLSIPKKNSDKPDLGYSNTTHKNSMLYGTLAEGYKEINWILTDPLKSLSGIIFSIDFNHLILDKDHKEIKFNFDKIVTEIDIYGSCQDNDGNKFILIANFFGVFDAKKPKTITFKDDNFLIFFRKIKQNLKI